MALEDSSIPAEIFWMLLLTSSMALNCSSVELPMRIFSWYSPFLIIKI